MVGKQLPVLIGHLVVHIQYPPDNLDFTCTGFDTMDTGFTGMVGVVMVLLQDGAKVNDDNLDGENNTPLHAAAGIFNPEIVCTLLKAKVNQGSTRRNHR